MKKRFLILALASVCNAEVLVAQSSGRAASSAPVSNQPARPAAVTRTQGARPGVFNLAEYGIEIAPDGRLLVVMAALEAAGFNPTSSSGGSAAFRARVNQDNANLNTDLRRRLQNFYERNKLKLPVPTTAAERSAHDAQQAARYVSLALALGQLPGLESPPRTDDLPAEVLEVLDFAALVREFYNTSGIKERLPQYLKEHEAEVVRLRGAMSEMVRTVLSYLHTRPIITTIERVPIKSTTSTKDGAKKSSSQKTVLNERLRRFIVMPDLLSPVGAINFRVIGDDYYLVMPHGTNPATSEVRRSYLQYVIDPLVVRYNREIARRRAVIKGLLDERVKAGNQVSADIFLAVERSLAAAADARITLSTQLSQLALETSRRLKAAASDAERERITKEDQATRALLNDERTAQLSEAYERGAVLAFYFAEQLQGLETSGFDIAGFLPDMIASFDPLRESTRPNEYAAVRERVAAARKARDAEAARMMEAEASTPAAAARARLVQQLTEVEDLLKRKNYAEADARLRAMLQEHQSEPRIHFALAQSASLSARDAFDEDLQAERLNRALAHYRSAVVSASPETDSALISRAYEAMGRIYAFLDKREDAVRAFDAAIQVGDVKGGAYNEALAGRKKLIQQP